MKRNLFFLVLLFLLNNSFNKVYGQTELITNGTFSSVNSWAFAYNNTPNSSGPVEISGGTLNSFADTNGNYFPTLNNNVLAVNTTPFNLVNGASYSFSVQMKKADVMFAASLSWVIINSSGNIVQTLGSYSTRAGSGTGTLLTTSNTTYTNTITFSGPSGSYHLAMVWISYQNTGSVGSVDDVIFDNVSVLSNILAIDDVDEVKNNPVRIYLNPTKNTLKILSDKNIKSYRIFDQTGRLIISSRPLEGNQQELDVSFIKTGVYIISIGTEEETVNKKFIK